MCLTTKKLLKMNMSEFTPSKQITPFYSIKKTYAFERGLDRYWAREREWRLNGADELGRTVAERILEFCSEPRYAKEINQHLGRAAGSPVLENYLLPLIEQGKLGRIEDYKRKGNCGYIAICK